MHVLLLLAAIALFAWLLWRRPAPPRRADADLERRLLHLCLGDRALFERLVAAEQARAPGIARAEAIDRAHALLTRSKA